jgi:hypothetical protein
VGYLVVIYGKAKGIRLSKSGGDEGFSVGENTDVKDQMGADG